MSNYSTGLLLNGTNGHCTEFTYVRKTDIFVTLKLSNFGYKGHYGENWENMNKVCRLNNNQCYIGYNQC